LEKKLIRNRRNIKRYSTKKDSSQLIKMEYNHAARTYHPIPVVIEKSSGVYVWDTSGKKYLDFLSAYSALNQGHNHPRIVDALKKQVDICALTSRAYYNSVFPLYAQYITKLFGYDKMLPMNTGAEGVETSLKLARKWGYVKKGIPPGKAVIISCKNSFHGRTLGAISLTSDPGALSFGPLVPGIKKINYNSISSLERVLKGNPNICAFIVEPIQGEAGVIIPSDGYLKSAYQLCKQHNVLFIADEIQTGLGRTGKLLASHWENVRPDITILGKALSGGLLPISCVLADDDIMLNLVPGDHGSTFGGNPLASAVAMESLKVLIEEKLPENAEKMGEYLHSELKKN